MSTKYEIIPPSRGALARRSESNQVTISPPRVNPGGIIDSTLTRWEANRHTRAIGAIGALHSPGHRQRLRRTGGRPTRRTPAELVSVIALVAR
jgi:hypothetical protein